jgi:hypothetical protein
VLRLDWKPAIDAVGILLKRDSATNDEAERLGYCPVRFTKMGAAVRYVGAAASEGCQLEYAYELAADFLELFPGTVSRWTRAFRADWYRRSSDGEKIPKPKNSFPPCQLFGSAPVVLCTPESIAAARKYVHENAVKKCARNMLDRHHHIIMSNKRVEFIYFSTPVIRLKMPFNMLRVAYAPAVWVIDAGSSEM